MYLNNINYNFDFIFKKVRFALVINLGNMSIFWLLFDCDIYNFVANIIAFLYYFNYAIIYM